MFFFILLNFSEVLLRSSNIFGFSKIFKIFPPILWSYMSTFKSFQIVFFYDSLE